jgi:acetyl esterase
MPHDPRMDADMAAYTEALAARAQQWPALVIPADPRAAPFDEPRRINDLQSAPLNPVGPAMAKTREFWWPIRGRRLALREHRPHGTPRGTLVYLHGGGWVWGSIDSHDRLAREYATSAGCTVLLVDYALSPEVAFPHALHECMDVVRRVAETPGPIAVGGDSAGANLAAAVGLLARDTGGPALAGLLLNYGVFDHRLDTPSYVEFAEGYGLTHAKMEFYWRAYCPDPAARMNPLASPLRARLEGLPPCQLHIAGLDVLAAENRAFAARLIAAGVNADTHEFPGVVHGFLRACGDVRAADASVAAAGAWLRGIFNSA